MRALPDNQSIGRWLRARWRLTRTARVPTLAGWVLLLLIVLATARLAAPGLYDWFACGQRAPDGGPPGSLVLEGWLPDATLQALVDHPYFEQAARIYCTGGPFEMGQMLTGHQTLAELVRARLLTLGVEPDRVVAVPAERVPHNRTWVAARTLRDELAVTPPPEPVWLISQGTHARRSHRLFRHALSGVVAIEVWALPAEFFGRDDWWRNSDGVKGMLGELLGVPYTVWSLWRTAPDAPLPPPVEPRIDLTGLTPARPRPVPDR